MSPELCQPFQDTWQLCNIRRKPSNQTHMKMVVCHESFLLICKLQYININHFSHVHWKPTKAWAHTAQGWPFTHGNDTWLVKASTTHLTVSGSLHQGPTWSISVSILNRYWKGFSFDLRFAITLPRRREWAGCCHAHSNWNSMDNTNQVDRSKRYTNFQNIQHHGYLSAGYGDQREQNVQGIWFLMLRLTLVYMSQWVDLYQMESC